MARKAPALPLSNMTGGINTFDRQAGESQIVDGIDVIEDNGDLIRRPAYVPVGHGPFYRLPAGALTVVHEYPLLTYTTITNRIFTTLDASRIGGLNGVLWIGGLEPFDGVDIRHILTVPTPTANRRIAVQYQNTGGVAVPAHGVVDTTNRRGSLSANSPRYHQPFMQDGYIRWHRDQFTNWTATSVNSLTRYWIRLDCTVEVPEPSATSITPAALSGTLTLEAPGMCPLIASPINGLYACKIRSSAPTVIMGADQKPKRGRESGASIAYWRNRMSPIDPARIVNYEGASVIGQATTPAWSHAGAATGTEGAANKLTKLDNAFDWRIDELRNSQLATFSPTAGSTTTVVNTTIALTLGVSTLENHRLLCTSVGGGGAGTPLNEYVEIVRSSATTITVYPAFSIAPVASNTFAVMTPPQQARTREGERNYEISSNTAQAAALLTSLWTPEFDANDTQRYGTYEIGRELPWAYESGRQWSFAYNSVTGTVLMTNGNTPILEYDGTRTRELAALSDLTDGNVGAAKAQDWNAAIEEVALTLGVDRVPTYLAHKPPIGRFIVDFNSYIVVGGLKDRESVIQWSAPGTFNDIWPNVNEAQIRNGENSSINGMWVFNGQLVVSTVSGLFAADPPLNGSGLVFRPVSKGIGFSSHWATCVINSSSSSLLLGPSADGIRAFTGGSPIEVLDRWDRLIPEGVNVRNLSSSVAAASLTNTLYFLAVPKSGSSVNDRLIVFDYSLKKFWVWTTAYGGITSIVCDIQESGKEQIYFGHADGTISVLAQHQRDGGAAITGRARSKSVSVGEGTAAFTGLMLNMRELGTTEVTVRTFLNNQDIANQEGTITVGFTGPLSVFPLIGGHAVGSSIFSRENFKTVRVNQTNASTGTAFQYELEFTSPSVRLQEVSLIATPKGQRHAT